MTLFKKNLKDPAQNDHFEDNDLDPNEQAAEEAEVINTLLNPANVDIFDKKITINSLLDRLKNGELNLSPDFRRRANLWDETRKSRLIESIFLRIPLPSFYFSEDKDGNYHVVDGLQRLCSIFHFIDHEALNKATGSRQPLGALRLQGMQYIKVRDGFLFTELEGVFQRRIKELEITVNVIRNTTPKEVMFNVFARLNQGGLPLTAQEIRNAIYPGVWQQHIREMVESNIFKTATGGKIPTERQLDMTMSLRFVAMWSLEAPYTRPLNETLDKFLNDTVEHRLSNWTDADWQRAKQQFERGLRAAIEVFGVQAFRTSIGQMRTTQINRGLFEAQTVILAAMTDEEIRVLTQRRDIVAQKLRNLLDTDNCFAIGLGSGAGNAFYSNDRMEKMIALLGEVSHD